MIKTWKLERNNADLPGFRVIGKPTTGEPWTEWIELGHVQFENGSGGFALMIDNPPVWVVTAHPEMIRRNNVGDYLLLGWHKSIRDAVDTLVFCWENMHR